MLSPITAPTRDNACLDHVFVRDAAKAEGFMYQSNVMDHNVCLLGLSFTRAKKQHIPKPTKVKTHFKAAISELLGSECSVVTSCGTVNKAVNGFNSIVRKALSENNMQRVSTLF